MPVISKNNLPFAIPHHFGKMCGFYRTSHQNPSENWGFARIKLLSRPNLGDGTEDDIMDRFTAELVERKHGESL